MFQDVLYIYNLRLLNNILLGKKLWGDFAKISLIENFRNNL